LRFGPEVLEAQAQVPVPEHLLTEVGDLPVHFRPEGGDALRRALDAPRDRRRFPLPRRVVGRHRGGVRVQQRPAEAHRMRLSALSADGHVPAVADDVYEAHVGEALKVER
jgi:hypothetical protein